MPAKSLGRRGNVAGRLRDGTVKCLEAETLIPTKQEPKQNEIGHPGQIQCFDYNKTLGAVGKADNGSYMLIVTCRRCR